jgi:protein-tyrosine phosphatase
VVCTANLARSPVLAALLQAHADHRLGPGVVTVASAGTDAGVGEPAAEGSRRLAVNLGLALDDHRSMPVMTVPLDGTSLVVAMSRGHRDYVRRRYPDLAGCTFTLRELTVLLDRAAADGALGEAVAGTGAGTRERLVAVAAVAHAHRPVRGRRRLDVPDPIGADAAAYEAMGEEFLAACDVFAEPLFGPGPR